MFLEKNFKKIFHPPGENNILIEVDISGLIIYFVIAMNNSG